MSAPIVSLEGNNIKVKHQIHSMRRKWLTEMSENEKSMEIKQIEGKLMNLNKSLHKGTTQ